MTEERIISGTDEETLWEQVNADFINDPDPLQYHVVLAQDGRRVLLDIDIDLGGGFEGGYAVTTFSAYLYSRNNFRFAIHTEDFLDEIGKFFGMQDVVLGYKEFDKRFVVKTNDEQKAVLLLADAEVRKTLEALPGLSFGIVQYTLEANDGKAPFLELRVEEGITDPVKLRDIYRAFFKVLVQLD